MNDELLNKVMQSVRIEARLPVRVRIAREANGVTTHAEEFEIPGVPDLGEVQRQVMSAAKSWKASFDVGVRFVVERLP